MDDLIIFYKDNYYLHSTDYDHLHYRGRKWREFLKESTQKNNGQLYVVKLGYPESEKVAVDIFVIKRKQLIAKKDLINFLQGHVAEDTTLPNFTSSITQQDYQQIFNSAMNSIFNGDLYQINLSFAFKSFWEQPSLYYFKRYAQKFSGDYFCCLPLSDRTLLSFSPELFIEKRGIKIVTKPIKGTIATDLGSEQLLNNPKEEAELSMVVDLLRNDLNSIADISNSKVVKHRALMDIGNIVHTYSEIECKSSLHISNILAQIFPGGSVTGCPKKSAMDKIAELEPTRRGDYTGSAGWIEGDNGIFSILIRSFSHFSDGDVSYSAGGGIVADSKVEQEYQEIFLKAESINGL